MGLDCYFTRVQREELAYYRKVNFLVKFFESKGLDIKNQVPLRLNKEDMEELKSRCENVLKDHSKVSELLPTTSGFFFGSTDYDDAYFKEVRVVADDTSLLLSMFDHLGMDEDIYFEIDY